MSDTTTIVLTGNAKKIFDLVDGLTAVELNALVKALEEKFDVSAAAPVMMAGGAAGGDDEGASDSVTVELTEVGQQKIAVIKTIKEILWVGLKEAKEVVEKAPAPVKEGIPAEEAELIKAKLEEAGATVTLK